MVIVHYHLRPGGIRRIIETATPYIIRRLPARISSVIIVSGEPPSPIWAEQFGSRIGDMPVEYHISPGFLYYSELNLDAKEIREMVENALRSIFKGNKEETIVWAHNLGIGRNLVMTRQLVRGCKKYGYTLMSHHHDWWFDNRWLRWTEFMDSGFKTLRSAANALYEPSDRLRHVAINNRDAQMLSKYFPDRSGWVPNLIEQIPVIDPERLARAHDWLRRKMRIGDSPIWLIPCRLLRRKNVAEALLLARWLRPEAWLVTTGGASSADEEYYSGMLAETARKHHWRLRLGILQSEEGDKPTVHELLGVSEAIMLTSIQEGFGLPFLEATAAGRPLVARALPNVSPDLEKFGFHFPQLYRDVLIDPSLFNWEGELRRQRLLFNNWLQRLPATCRSWVGKPAVLSAGSEGKPVPFSRLTLTAQIEILSKPRERSWELCKQLNPFLGQWREKAADGKLEKTPWPETAGQWLSGESYAERFINVLESTCTDTPPESGAMDLLEDFIRRQLQPGNLFPLLWSKHS